MMTATWVDEVRTDAAGKYVFARVPPGDGSLARQLADVGGGPPLNLQQTYVTVQPAQRVSMSIGGAAGCAGRLRQAGR